MAGRRRKNPDAEHITEFATGLSELPMKLIKQILDTHHRSMLEQLTETIGEMTAEKKRLEAQIARMIVALDAIYNHNEAAKQAVIQHYWKDAP